MYAYRVDGYWKDVGTISSLWEANMEVLDPEHSGINLFDENWKIYSRNSGMTGHRIGADAEVENSMITDGCRIHGKVKHSILFAGVSVEPGAVVEDAVVMGGTVIKAGAQVRHCTVSYTHLKDVLFCPNGGTKIERPQPESEPQPTEKVCPECGAAVDEDDVFCTNCGARVDSEESSEKDDKQTESEPTDTQQ